MASIQESCACLKRLVRDLSKLAESGNEEAASELERILLIVTALDA